MSHTGWLIVAIVAGTLLVAGWVARESRSTAAVASGEREEISG